MKKLFLISFICIASSAISLAQLKVIPTGEVGIGITNPLTKLHIRGANPFITLENSNNSKKWHFGINGSDFNIVETGVGTPLFIQNTTGNIGIGTTSPNNLLQVAGLINFNPTLNNTFLGTNAGINSSGSYNTATGYNSLYSNISGANNTTFGWKSGYSNTSGANNTFSGYQSGYTNTTGAGNTFSGYQSGKVNTASYNTFSGGYCGVANTSGNYNAFFGYQSGYYNTTGNQNTFLGIQAGLANTSGYYNTYTGGLAGYYNTTGYYNVFNGWKAGYNNISGKGNTAVGYAAGLAYATCDSSTFIGHRADASGNYYNATAIGNRALVLASNRVMIGNTSVTQIGGYVGWTNISDGRFKVNIQENVKGLEFINKLRPVTYQMNTQSLDAFIMQNMPQATDSSGNIIPATTGAYSASMSVVHSGFIAQEVEQAENESGFTSSIVSAPANNNDPYAICYAEFVVPLVKAVQELNATVVQQGLEIQELKARLDQCCKTVPPSTIDGK